MTERVAPAEGACAGCGPILVVEDDDDIRETTMDVLEAEGYAVVGASNGLEGLRRLEEAQRPCVILLDLMMPVMSGQEFLLRLRKEARWETIPVVVVSAWPHEAAKLTASKAAQDFVRKPVDLARLLASIGKHC